VLVGVVWWRHRKPRMLAAALLPICVLTLAWGWRNHVQVGQFLPFSSRLGYVLLLDNNATALQEPFWPPYDCRFLDRSDRRRLMALAPPLTDPAYEGWLSAKAWVMTRQAVGERPDLYLRRCLRRLIAFYSPWMTKTTRQAQLGQALKWGLVLVPGAIVLWRRRREPWSRVCLAYVVLTTVELNLMIGLCTQRYRVLIEPAFAFGAATLYASLGRTGGPDT